MTKVTGKIRTDPLVKTGPDWKLVIYDIDRKTYSTFNEAFQNFKRGEDVEIEFETKGEYNTIKTINLIGNKSIEQFKPDKEPVDDFVDRQRLIVRQNALTNANELFRTCYDKYMNEKGTPDEILVRIAEKLEAWVFRE